MLTAFSETAYLLPVQSSQAINFSPFLCKKRIFRAQRSQAFSSG
jgi:hypothetical protein